MVIAEVVAPPGLQSKLPVSVVDKTEFPQLLTTVTKGVAGVALGAAVFVP